MELRIISAQEIEDVVGFGPTDEEMRLFEDIAIAQVMINIRQFVDEVRRTGQWLDSRGLKIACMLEGRLPTE